MKWISPLESSCKIYLTHRISSNSETVEIYTFFEAHSIRCRKTIFDVTKVTYNMYSCVISYMSREMMEMDGRDSAKCRKSKFGDIDGIIGFVLNDNNAKIVNSIISYKLKRSPNVKKKKNRGDA